jgi:hypothetical protein
LSHVLEVDRQKMSSLEATQVITIYYGPNNNSIPYIRGSTCGHDINEWFKMNITFPKLPDFMKIENMNTIDIDIYKMKGIYIITYE